MRKSRTSTPLLCSFMRVGFPGIVGDVVAARELVSSLLLLLLLFLLRISELYCQ